MDDQRTFPRIIDGLSAPIAVTTPDGRVDERQRAEALLAGEKRLLEMVASANPLRDVLEELCRLVEILVGNCTCSLLLVEPNGTFRFGAGPTLPPGYDRMVEGAPVVCEAGPCGTAGALKEQVSVSDLVSEPRWVGLGWRTLALEHGLRSVCSTPIVALTGDVLGTFAIYLREPVPPSTLLKDLIGRFTHIASIAIERDRAQAALTSALADVKKSEAELRDIVDLIPMFVVVLAPDGQALHVNQSTLDYTGLAAHETRGLEFRQRVFHPDDVERSRAFRSGALERGLPFESEQRVRRHDGVYRWFLIRYRALHDEQGRVTRWYATATDIDERKRTEERVHNENLALREEIDRSSMFEEIVGASKPLKAVLSRLTKVAPTDSTVLIAGETGTGKELVARAIHRRSPRAARPFVSVNCAAVPRELIASELFGHEKGAFTGATQRRLGRFELAHGGTIFLDEVGELPMETQVALLRVLQEREFERVGGSASIRVDVRVIAATNRDLQAAIEVGTFRSDLFYRLNVFPITMPALRERADDIPLLVPYFIDRYARKAGKTIRRINARTLDHLKSYPWPGNVRELQNVIERSVIVCDTDEFTVDESWLSARPPIEGALALSGTLAAQEKTLIEDALRASGGRVFGPSGAAARLGIPRSTLESKIRTLKINKGRFRARPAKP
jgi:formate hydrogenlyase transcriptional activator